MGRYRFVVRQAPQFQPVVAVGEFQGCANFEPIVVVLEFAMLDQPFEQRGGVAFIILPDLRCTALYGRGFWQDVL